MITPTSLFAESCSSQWDKLLQSNDIPERYIHLKGYCGVSLKNKLWDVIKGNLYFDYKKVRAEFFSRIDNVDGYVCSVYTDLCVKTEGIPDALIMNCEHSWPQSLGAIGKAKSDLHHLFPVESPVNSKRSNKPFCEVNDPTWERDGSYFGWSSYGTECFEPPTRHKGDLARAMLYFSIRYSKPLDIEQETFFKKWNKEDPVSSKEYLRNEDIAEFQKNRNPFIDAPVLVDLISDF